MQRHAPRAMPNDWQYSRSSLVFARTEVLGIILIFIWIERIFVSAQYRKIIMRVL